MITNINIIIARIAELSLLFLLRMIIIIIAIIIIITILLSSLSEMMTMLIDYYDYYTQRWVCYVISFYLREVVNWEKTCIKKNNKKLWQNHCTAFSLSNCSITICTYIVSNVHSHCHLWHYFTLYANSIYNIFFKIQVPSISVHTLFTHTMLWKMIRFHTYHIYLTVNYILYFKFSSSLRNIISPRY